MAGPSSGGYPEPSTRWPKGEAIRKRLRRIALAVIALVTTGLVAFVVYYRLNDESAVIDADRTDHGPPPASLGLSIQPVALTAADGVKLAAWRIDPKSDGDRAFWVLHLHGNSSNLSTPGYAESYSYLQAIGAGILAVEYRGFGKSEGTVSEAGLYADAAAGYRYLREVVNVPPERIVAYGFSLGSGVAAQLATTVPVAGLVLEGAYTSIRDRAQASHPLVPIPLLIGDRFNTLSRIAAVNAPKLFIHGTGDTTIPITDARALFAAAREPKTFLEVPGEHATAFRTDRARFYGGVAAFLASLRHN
ncbi:MAG: alpha/beta fold hydrolase [Bauldia sp.]